MTRYLAALLLALPAAGIAQTPASPPDSEARVLLRLEDDWAVGLVRRDSALFQRLLADGFVYTEDDQTIGRAEALHGLIAGPETVTSAHNEDMTVHRFGSTAIVTGWLIIVGHSTQGPFTHRYRFTDTWMRREGQWQIVGAQDYLVPRR